MSITNIINKTRGLTDRNEICVINNIGSYGFQIVRPNTPRCVEYPQYPPLVVGEAGFKEDGLCRQIRGQGNQNFGPNTYEMIEHNRYKQVKELMGYVGAKTAEYKLYKVEPKEIQYPTLFMSCGDSQDIDINGLVYTKDTGSGGGAHQRLNQNILSGGQYERIYQTLRATSTMMSWNININENGKYLVILRFADFWMSDESSTLIINGAVRKTNFNVIDKVGDRYRRYDMRLRVPVTNNEIEIEFSGRSVLNAIEVYRLRKEDVEFELASRDDMISNRDIFLFVNNAITASEQTIKNKFLDIYKTILRSRHSFFF